MANALKAGRIGALADGTIGPVQADTAWVATTTPRLETPPPSRQRAGRATVVDGTAFPGARTAKMQPEAERARLEPRVRTAP